MSFLQSIVSGHRPHVWSRCSFVTHGSSPGTQVCRALSYPKNSHHSTRLASSDLRIRAAVSEQSSVPGENQVVLRRNGDYFHPSVWGDYFTEREGPQKIQECNIIMEERIEELKEQIKSLLDDAKDDVLQTMDLVDSLQLLGLEYHFEVEIKEALRRIYDADITMHGLHYVALRFRLLRQRGYYVSPDVFNRFRDEEHKFLAGLKDDAKGLLSLYDTAYLRTHGETILDEAVSFTRCHLTSSLSSDDLEQPLAAQISLDLEIPLRRRTRRLLTRYYIPIYQESPTRNEAVLELAKLDFNLLQSLHREEVKSISRWWNNKFKSKNLNFIRDRIAEVYYSVLGLCPEAQYSRSRVITARVLAVVSILDDINDSHGTLEECRRLNEAIQSWDAEAVDQLPEYIKDYFLELIRTYEEFEDMLDANEKYRILHLKETIKAISRAYFEQSRWAADKYVPTLEEHLRVSLISSAFSLTQCAVFVGMGEVATEEVFQKLTTFSKLVRACSLIGRVENDIVSFEREQAAGVFATTVECYMKEHGMDLQVAKEKLKDLVEDAWKDVHEEYHNPNSIPFVLLERILDFVRLMETLYKHDDGYTASSEKTKEYISSLLVNPIPM